MKKLLQRTLGAIALLATAMGFATTASAEDVNEKITFDSSTFTTANNKTASTDNVTVTANDEVKWNSSYLKVAGSGCLTFKSTTQVIKAVSVHTPKSGIISPSATLQVNLGSDVICPAVNVSTNDTEYSFSIPTANQGKGNEYKLINTTTKNAQITSITFTLEGETGLGDVVVTLPNDTKVVAGETYTIYQGQTISVKSANATSIHVYALDADAEEVVNATTDGATTSWTAENIASELTFEITAKLDNDEKAVMFTLNVVEMPEPENYVLVSSTDELVEGVTFLIAGDKDGGGKFSLMSNEMGGNYFNAIQDTDAEAYGYAKNDNIVTLSYIEGANAGKIAIVTLEGNITDGFKIKNQNNEYIQVTPTTDKSNIALTKDVANATVFTISIDENGKYTIKVSGGTSEYNLFSYNASYPRFTIYKDSQGQIYLYAKVGKPEMPKPIVEDGVTITETAEGWSVVPTTYPVILTFTVDENTDIYHMDVTPGAEPAAAPAKEGDGHTILTENTLVLKAPGEVHSVYAMKHGVQSDKKMITAEVPTGIKGISETTTPVQYFNLQGVRIDKPAKGGIYIKVQGKNTSKIVF